MSRRAGARDGGEVTKLLRAWSDGEADAFERVLPLVYDELHRMAARYLVGERSSISLQPTALVNELCLRLLGWDPVPWQSRGHFFGVSAGMMRRVLVDIARRRRAERRGGPERSGCRSNDRRRGQRAGRRPARRGRGAPDARPGGSAQGPGRGAALLRRPLHRGDGGGARDIGPHRPHGLGIRAGMALSDADGGPCPLTAGIGSRSCSWGVGSARRRCVRTTSPATCGPDAGMRDEVASLLTAAERSGDFLTAPALDVFARQISREGWSVQPGDRIGVLHRRAAARSGRDGRGLAGARRAARARRGDQAAPSASLERGERVRAFGTRRAPPARSTTPTC